MEFSTIELANNFVTSLETKEYVIIIGNMATEGFKSL